MAIPTNQSYSDYCYASVEYRPMVLKGDVAYAGPVETRQPSVVHPREKSAYLGDYMYEECRPQGDEKHAYLDRESIIYDSPIEIIEQAIPEYAVVNKRVNEQYDTVADPVGFIPPSDDLYAVVDKAKKSQNKITNSACTSEDSRGIENDHSLSDPHVRKGKTGNSDLYEDLDSLSPPPENQREASGARMLLLAGDTTSPTMNVVGDETLEPDVLESKSAAAGSNQKFRKGSPKSDKANRSTEFNLETAQEKGYVFHNGLAGLDITGDIKKERGSKKKKGGNSKFFVSIPEKKGVAPPPKPRPFVEVAGGRDLGRKMSLPISALQTHDEENCESKATKGLNKLDRKGRQAFSSENLLNNYAEVRDDKGFYNRASSYYKGHKRNLSYDNLDFKRNSVDISSLNSDAVGNGAQTSLGSFKKQHVRIRSHENVSKIFSSTPRGSQTDLNDAGREHSPQSGKASVESSISSESAASVPSKSSRGSVDSADSTDMDMRELLKQAEDLVSEELPEGWQEVRDGNETYYWHIWTGTIQYERPMLSTSSSSRSVSPISSQDSCSSKNTSFNDLRDRGSQSKSPQPLQRPESPPNNIKQAISFPVHSMGWMDVEEDQMTPACLGDTVNNCITTLAGQRNDLWNTGDTWGEGKDIKLILEGEVLKLVEPRKKQILLNQPIAKMRVWGVGKEDQRDFAYIARDPRTGKHKCHMFRCHGSVSGRSITNALHSICNRVLEEKRRAKERASPSVKAGSDLLHAPVSQTAKVSSGFNEKPFIEQKKSFTAKYVGFTEVTKPSGIEVLNKAVTKLTTGATSSSWRSVLVEITTSEIRTIDCTNQAILMEDRVRFVSFLGIARDEKMCGYIVAVGQDNFICHVFMCAPHAGILTKAIEEACRLRYEKVLDRRALEDRRVSDPQIHSNQKSIVKEKGLAFKSSVQELFHKFQKKEGRRRGSKQDEGSQTSPENKSPPLQPGANEVMVKYFGCVPVTIGTGMDTVQQSVEHLSGGSMMVGYLEVTMETLTLYDSQRTALSRRVIDLDTVSYCGMTGDKKHFGIIVTQGRGKYVCHVFQEYKTPVEQIVAAVNEVL